MCDIYEERFKESFDNVQLDGNFKGKKYEDILKKFNESDAFIYFEECLDSKDKQIVLKVIKALKEGYDRERKGK